MAKPKINYYLSHAFKMFQGREIPVVVQKSVITQEHSAPYHRHDFPQFIYCAKGNHRHIINDVAYECTKGDIILIPSGAIHKFWVAEGQGTEVWLISVDTELLLSKAPEQYKNTIFRLFLPAFGDELKYNFSSCISLSLASQEVIEDVGTWLSMLEFAPRKTVNTDEVCRKLEELFSLPELAMPQSVQNTAQTLIHMRLWPILKILSYLNVHYPEKIQEEVLLQVSGISHAGLHRYFKRVFGCTYSEYLQQLRTWRACIYLKYTSYSIAHIADLCGFYDSTHMSQTFLRYVTISPSKKREELKRALMMHPEGWKMAKYLISSGKDE